MSRRRPNGDGSIFKRVDGRWEGRIVVGHKKNGTPIYRSAFGKTQKELMPKFNRLKEYYSAIRLTEDKIMTLEEWLDKWIREYKEPMIRSSTLMSYKRYIDCYINPYLGNKLVTQIKTSDIQKLYNTIKRVGRVHENQQKGNELSNTTVQSVHRILHGSLDAAVREGMVPVNPTDGTTLPRIEKTSKTVLLESQIEKFMKVLDGDTVWHDFFYTELTTGMRRGEICGLKWSDFDEESGMLHIQRTIRYTKGELIIGETKTNQGKRKIVLPASVAQMLRERKKTCYTEWVFPKELNPEFPVDPGRAYKELKRILKEADLPDMRFHDLRHTFATHAASNGIDPKTLAEILGHTKASFTLDRYTHVTTDMQKQAAGIVGNFITDIFGKELKPWQREEKQAKVQ